MKELAKDQMTHIPQFMEDAAETQWNSCGLPTGMSMERESLHFSVTGRGNLNSPSINSGWEPLTKVEDNQDVAPYTWKCSGLIPFILGMWIMFS